MSVDSSKISGCIGNGPTGVKLVPTQNLHLTLHFLGDVPAEDERRLRSGLANARMSRFDLTLAKADVFDHGVAILRPQESEALHRLQAELRGTLEGVGLPAEVRQWQPHVTLARKAAGAVPPTQPASIDWTATQLELVWSRGSSYEVVQSWQATA